MEEVNVGRRKVESLRKEEFSRWRTGKRKRMERKYEGRDGEENEEGMNVVNGEGEEGHLEGLDKNGEILNGRWDKGREKKEKMGKGGIFMRSERER